MILLSVLQDKDTYRLLNLIKKYAQNISGGDATKYVVLSQEDYDSLEDAGSIADNTFYMIKDESDEGGD